MAEKYWIGGGTNSNWNASPSTNWAATSGDTVRVAAPGVADNVHFDGVGTTANSASVVSANNSCLSIVFTSGYTNTITINTAVVLTVAGAFTDNTAHSWTVNGTGSMAISAASTITSGGKTFPSPVSFSGSNTKTLVGDWTITGTLTCATNTTTINHTTAEVLNVGGLVINGTTAGNITLNMTGGTWSGNLAVLQCNLTIGGNVTLGTANDVVYNTGTITYNSGTVTSTSNTLRLTGSATLNTNGMSWNNINITVAATITINSLLTANGTLTIGDAAITFAGTTGFTAATVTVPAIQARTYTLVHAVTYTITTAFNCFLSRAGAIALFTSDDGTIKAILTLNQGATCNVLASFTRIDASNGRAIWTFNGTVTDCINIFSLTNLSFVTGRSQVIQAGGNY